MNDNSRSPTDLEASIAALWHLNPVDWGELSRAPEFARLCDICQHRYPTSRVSPRQRLVFALSNALRAFGLTNGSTSQGETLISIEDASAQLDAAFRRTQSIYTYLCPLDWAGNLPNLTFGSNYIKKFLAAELEDLVDAPRLKRTHPTRAFDAECFSEFNWLVVKEVVPLGTKPETRTVRNFSNNFNVDFGSIEPHPDRFPKSVELALFALLLVPWEDWTYYAAIDWRAFRVPWIYATHDDIFDLIAPPPSPDSLSWLQETGTDQHGEEVEFMVPAQLSLDCADASVALNDTAWLDLERARQSPLFETPIAHFLVRAFLSDGIDEFLAHITAIEAAVGLGIDYDNRGRPKLANCKNPGATKRMAMRLSALLQDQAAATDFEKLFDARSQYLHGRAMDRIPGELRVSARRLARRTVTALTKVALDNPSLSRDEYLNKLLGSVPF